jgi:hypothetical protein
MNNGNAGVITHVSIWPGDSAPGLQPFERQSRDTGYALRVAADAAGTMIFFESRSQLEAWMDTINALITDSYVNNVASRLSPVEELT